MLHMCVYIYIYIYIGKRYVWMFTPVDTTRPCPPPLWQTTDDSFWRARVATLTSWRSVYSNGAPKGTLLVPCGKERASNNFCFHGSGACTTPDR